MDVGDDHAPPDDLESREPSVEDLVKLAEYVVTRVADEIVVDLMTSASGIGYAEAEREVVVHEISGVPISFASPWLLWRMKKSSLRDKDAPDIHFLRLLLGRS